MTECTWCGAEIEDHLWACPACGNDPSTGPRRDATVVEPGNPVAPPPSPSRPGTAEPEPERCAAAGCGGPLAADQDRCALCGTLRSAAETSAVGVAARFTWGDVPVPAAGIDLGREAGPDDVRAFLSGHDNVSRLHAHLAWCATHFTVTDLGSTNGTFVDGRRIDPHRPETVHPGQRVRLAADVDFELVGGPTCS